MTPSSSKGKNHQASVLPLHEERGARAGDPPTYELQSIASGMAAPPTPASSGYATPVAPPRAVTPAADAYVAEPVAEAVQERRRSSSAVWPVATDDPVQVAVVLVLGLGAFLVGAVLVVALIFGAFRLLRYFFR